MIYLTADPIRRGGPTYDFLERITAVYEELISLDQDQRMHDNMDTSERTEQKRQDDIEKMRKKYPIANIR